MKGFTLIELLAVIVILAIIALIATPIVLGIIDDARESAIVRSAEFYLDGVENAVAKENLEQEGNFKPTECTITNEGNLSCDDKEGILEVEVDGEKPKNGIIRFEEGKIKYVVLKYKDEKIIEMTEDKSLVYIELSYKSLGNYYHESSNGLIEIHDNNNGICLKCDEKILEPGVYDENNNLLASWDTLVNNYGLNIESDYAESRVSGTMYDVLYNNSELSNATKVIIPKTITKIGNFTFAVCRKLTSVSIPNSVQTIGDKAFSGCYEITKLELGNSVQTIGHQAFYNCYGLTELIIPKSVQVIDIGAFKKCTGLTSVKFEKSEWYLEDGVTVDTSNVSTNAVNLTSTYTNEIWIASSPAGLYDANDKLIASWNKLINIYGLDIETNYTTETYKTNNSMYYVLTNNSELSSGTKIVIPSSVNKIGERAFQDCTSLISIIIPDSVTSIGNYAFRSCSNLSSLIIPSSVTTIGAVSLENCDKLTNLTIENNMIQFQTVQFGSPPGTFTLFFSSGRSLSVINYAGTKAQWNERGFKTYFIHPTITVYCTDGNITLSEVTSWSSPLF